jgi:hypothetical protein
MLSDGMAMNGAPNTFVRSTVRMQFSPPAADVQEAENRLPGEPAVSAARKSSGSGGVAYAWAYS